MCLFFVGKSEYIALIIKRAWLVLLNRDCGKLLVSLHSNAARSKLQGVFRKYSVSERGAVALLPPAKTLLPHV